MPKNLCAVCLVIHFGVLSHLMDILDRYLFKSFIKIFVGTLILLVGISVIVSVIDSLKRFTDNTHGVELLVKYYLTITPSYVTYIVPPALLFATAFTISNFNRHFELTVIMAAGRSFRRILRPLLIFAALFSVGFFFFNEFVAFPSAYKAVDISYALRNRGENVRLTKSYKLVQLTYRFENRYYTVGRADWIGHSLNGFHLLELNPQGGVVRIIEADKASVLTNESRVWTLSRVHFIHFNAQGDYQRTENYETYAIEIPESLASFQNNFVEMDSEERSVFDAYHIYKKRKASGGTYSVFLTEVFWHIGYPLICFFIVYIGGMLGGRIKKGGIALSIAVSMLFTLLYFFFMYFGNAFGESETLPPFIAGNLSNYISLALSAWIFWRVDY